MKLSTFAIALTLSVAATQSFAKDVVLKPINDNIETQACLTAAEDGFGPAYFGESDRSFRFYPITFSSSFSSLQFYLK